MLEGEIEAVIGFETRHLGVGDSLAVDPATPHLYRNPTERAIRGVVARLRSRPVRAAQRNTRRLGRAAANGRLTRRWCPRGRG